MSKLAIIPARGGSKRIPGKNIRPFLGKPIIAYSIEAALNSGLFDTVMVSTDSEEIAAVAREFGAEVPFFRSAANADDFATTIAVVHEVLDTFRESGKTFEYACCIYPTAPLIQNSQLKAGLELLIKNNYTSVFPIVAYGYPVWRGLEINDDQSVKMIWPDMQNERSQDLKKVYHDAGQWYWLKTTNLKDSIFTANSGSLVLEETCVQDIDSELDWKLAELKYQLGK